MGVHKLRLHVTKTGQRQTIFTERTSFGPQVNNHQKNRWSSGSKKYRPGCQHWGWITSPYPFNTLQHSKYIKEIKLRTAAEKIPLET